MIDASQYKQKNAAFYDYVIGVFISRIIRSLGMGRSLNSVYRDPIILPLMPRADNGHNRIMGGFPLLKAIINAILVVIKIDNFHLFSKLRRSDPR